MLPTHPFERHVAALFDHRKASLTAFLSLMQLHSRLARLRTGATANFGLTHARLRVLRVIAAHRDFCITDIARELDLSRQAVHRVVHDLCRLRMIKLTASPRGLRERVPKLRSGGRVAVKCGLRWEQHWFESLGESASLHQLQWLDWLAQRYRRHLPWRVDDDVSALEMPPRPLRSTWRLLLSSSRPAPPASSLPAPAAAGSGCAARAAASR